MEKARIECAYDWVCRGLGSGSKRRIRGIGRLFLALVPFFRNLEVLCVVYGSDKRRHGYLPHYRQFFGPFRKQRISLLEIGVGGYKAPNSGGGSLRMWKRYFPKGRIFGLDVYDKSALEEKRIKIYRGSQNDPVFLERLGREVGLFNFIIDDGSHVNEHVITSFQVLFPFLRGGGIYAVEDISTAYNPRYGGDPDNFANPTTSLGYFKALVDKVNQRFIPPGRLNGLPGEVETIHFFSELVVIVKGHAGRAL